MIAFTCSLTLLPEVMNKILKYPSISAGRYYINRQCQKYQEFCNTPGNSLQYAKVLLQSQEANFIIATTVNFIYVVILCRYLAAITSNLSTMNGSNSLDDAGEDKVLYSQVAN